ncbi:extracellular matrix/biofilm biosynthesis regulator RemA family protein [Proteinivorax tanatarense]|uniref:Extracellular matrix/biofilm biosynthesis regulator RemA family protein n=1 Tax=Proteinivorax tanatarense TaxID=1260629 RepID=A0AAU7VLT3_9FIRM
MFLHLGGSTVISLKGVIGIFDYSLTKTNHVNNYFNNGKKIIKICEDDEFKSFIITNKEIYLSPIAANTLKKRINSQNFTEKVNILQEHPTFK